MYVLAFESSCDETACAVLEMSEDTREIKSNIIASQVDIHALYGGVVPEIASRAHIEAISSITYEALDKAGISLADVGAICVTNLHIRILTGLVSPQVSPKTKSEIICFFLALADIFLLHL